MFAPDGIYLLSKVVWHIRGTQKLWETPPSARLGLQVFHCKAFAWDSRNWCVWGWPLASWVTRVCLCSEPTWGTERNRGLFHTALFLPPPPPWQHLKTMCLFNLVWELFPVHFWLEFFWASLHLKQQRQLWLNMDFPLAVQHNCACATM